MIAYAIKDKEGRYLRNKTGWVSNLYGAKLFLLKEDADTYLKTTDYELDDEVVKITINEEKVKRYDITSSYAYGKEYVDKLKEKNKKLMEENKQLKRARKELRRKFEQEERSNIDNISDAEEIVEQLKQQLEEKDKEIEELKTFNAKNTYDTICHALNMQEKQIRHHVCDEVRNYIDSNDHEEVNEAKQSSDGSIYTRLLYDFLNKIEQGEYK